MLVRQRDDTDCGASCIASVCAFHKLKLRVAGIRMMAGTDQSGTSVSGMLRAASCLGLIAKAVRAPPECLHELPLPAIAHIVSPAGQGHYMVLAKVTAVNLVVMDPAAGSFKKISRADFDKLWSGVVVLMIPGDAFTPENNLSVWKRLAALAAPHWKMLTFICSMAAITAVTGLSVSVYLRHVVDNAWNQRDTVMLDSLSLLMMILIGLHVVATFIKNVLTLRTSRMIDEKLILGYYRHLMYLPQRFFESMRVGELISRVNDSIRISSFINEVVINVILNTVLSIFTLAVMVTYNWKLAAIMSSAVPFYLTLVYYGDKKNVSWQRKTMERSAAFGAQMVEGLTAAATIKSLALEEHSCRKTERLFGGVMETVYRSSVFNVWISGSADLVTRIFALLVLWMGSHFVMQKTVTAGELISFYTLITYFTVAVMGLLGAAAPIREMMVAADRLFEIMDLKLETIGSDAAPVPGYIQFHDVYHRYGNSADVLKGVSFRINGGSITGITGESGAGKSTIARLIQRIDEPASGRVAINNCNIAGMDLLSLRKMITCVPQQTHLFSVSIAENIAFGFSDPEMEKIWLLCDRLGINEFADKLPRGLHTTVEEHGSNFSGGHKQKIAIARALYRDPAVVILDEATSSMDAWSEKKVLETLQWYRQKGSTIIIIAHKDSTLKICDNIIQLENGRIV